MSDQNSDLDALLQERDDLDAAIEQARLTSADGEETPAPEVESPTPAVTETPTPASQTAIIAAINKLEAEGKFAEASPLKAKLLEIQSGFSGLSQPAAAAAEPTVQELRQQIDAFEAKGDWKSSGALKSQIVQRTPVDGISQ